MQRVHGASKSQNERTKEPFLLFLESPLSSNLVSRGARNRNDRTDSNCRLHGPAQDSVEGEEEVGVECEIGV